MQVEPSVQKLYDYIYERGTIVPVEDYSMELLSQGDISKRVTESIRYAHSYLKHSNLNSYWCPLTPNIIASLEDLLG